MRNPYTIFTSACGTTYDVVQQALNVPYRAHLTKKCAPAVERFWRELRESGHFANIATKEN